MNADQIMKEAKDAYFKTSGGDTDYSQALKKALCDMYLLATGEEYKDNL